MRHRADLDSLRALGAAVVVCTAVGAKSGVWLVPWLETYWRVSQQLTHNHSGDYLYTSYLQPMAFAAVGGRSLDAFALYSAAATLTFITCLIAACAKAGGWTWKLSALIVFPAVTVPVYWIGQDGLTMLLMLLIVMNLETRWAVLFALLLSWQHWEQGLLGFTLLAVTLLFRDAEKFRRVVSVVTALLIGRLALKVYLFTVGVTVQVNRTGYAAAHLREFFDLWLAGWPAIPWSVEGLGWVLLLLTARQTWPVWSAAPIVFVLLIFAADHTRVGTILMLPALLYWALLRREFWRALRPAWVVAVVIAFLLLPTLWVWGSAQCTSVREYTLAQLRFRPWPSTWSGADFVWPFAAGACPRPDLQ